MPTRILYVAYQFPPLTAIGAQRPFKFLREWAKDDTLDLHVLRLSPDSYGNVYDNFSAITNQEIDPIAGVTIHELESKDIRMSSQSKLGGFLKSFFDVYRGQEASGVEGLSGRLRKLHGTHNFEVVVISCPPFSIGSEVATWCRYAGVTYVVDMRDAWSLWCDHPYKSKSHYNRTVRAEHTLLAGAGAVVCVTDAQKQDFIRQHPDIDKVKFFVVPNAFESVAGVYDQPLDLAFKPKVRLGYIGSTYYDPIAEATFNKPWYKRKPWQWMYYSPRREYWKYRSLYFLFKLLEHLRDSNRELYNRLEVHVAGSSDQWRRDQIEDAGLEDKVQLLGYLKGEELREFYDSCDLMVCTAAKNEDGKDYCLAGKTFEYVQYGKRMLGMVPNGEQKDFIERTGTGIALDPDNLEESGERLSAFLQQPLQPVDREVLNGYSIEVTAAHFLNVVNTACGQ